MLENILHRFKPKHERTTELNLNLLFTSFGFGIVDTIWALYLKSFFNNDSIVGLISTILMIVSFFALILLVPIVERYNEKKLYITGLAIMMISYIIFAINKASILFLLLFVVISVIGQTLRNETRGILIKDLSKRKNIGKNMGLSSALINVGYTLGPLLGGFALSKFGFSHSFILAAIFLTIGIIIALPIKIKPKHIDEKKIDKNPFKNARDFLKRKELIKSYIVSSAIAVWWGFIYIYVPLYLVKQNVPTYWLGYFFFSIALPLVLFEPYFGKQADKRGYRKLFILGYAVMAFCIIAASTELTPTFVLFAIAMGSIPAAAVESNVSGYFFRITKPREEKKFYGLYLSSYTMGAVITRFIPAILLLFFPYKIAFLFVGFYMLIASFTASKLKRNK